MGVLLELVVELTESVSQLSKWSDGIDSYPPLDGGDDMGDDHGDENGDDGHVPLLLISIIADTVWGGNIDVYGK